MTLVLALCVCVCVCVYTCVQMSVLKVNCQHCETRSKHKRLQRMLIRHCTHTKRLFIKKLYDPFIYFVLSNEVYYNNTCSV